MALNLVCKISFHFKEDLSNNAPLLNYYSPSIQARRVSAHWPTLQQKHSTKRRFSFAPKAAKPSAGSAPSVALCPPLPTATVGPGPIPASRDSARGAVTLGEVTMHLLRGSKMLTYPGKKLIFPMQRLDKQGFGQAGLWAQLLPCLQNRMRVCAVKFDMEVEHHGSIPASPWILGLKMVALVSHQAHGMNDIFQDGHFLQLKSYCSSRFHIFWCDSDTS